MPEPEKKGSGAAVAAGAIIGLGALGAIIYFASRAAANGKEPPKPPYIYEHDTYSVVLQEYADGTKLVECRARYPYTGIRECWPLGQKVIPPPPPPSPPPPPLPHLPLSPPSPTYQNVQSAYEPQNYQR